MLRGVAKSSTEEAFQANLSSLKGSDLWSANPKLRNWFEKTWLVEAKVRVHTTNISFGFVYQFSN